MSIKSWFAHVQRVLQSCFFVQMEDLTDFNSLQSTQTPRLTVDN